MFAAMIGAVIVLLADHATRRVGERLTARRAYRPSKKFKRDLRPVKPGR
jgi:hypothetical protein